MQLQKHDDAYNFFKLWLIEGGRRSDRSDQWAVTQKSPRGENDTRKRVKTPHLQRWTNPKKIHKEIYPNGNIHKSVSFSSPSSKAITAKSLGDRVFTQKRPVRPADEVLVAVQEAIHVGGVVGRGPRRLDRGNGSQGRSASTARDSVQIFFMNTSKNKMGEKKKERTGYVEILSAA